VSGQKVPAGQRQVGLLFTAGQNYVNVKVFGQQTDYKFFYKALFFDILVITVQFNMALWIFYVFYQFLCFIL